MRRWPAPVAAPVLISALVLGACGCTASSTASTKAGSATGSPARSASQPAPTGSMAMPQEPAGPLDPKRQAVELRTGLEELFGQDVFVGIRVTTQSAPGYAYAHEHVLTE